MQLLFNYSEKHSSQNKFYNELILARYHIKNVKTHKLQVRVAET